MSRVINFCSITEFVAVLVSALRLFVVKRNRINSKGVQRMQFRRLRHSIVILFEQGNTRKLGVSLRVLSKDSLTSTGL